MITEHSNSNDREREIHRVLWEHGSESSFLTVRENKLALQGQVRITWNWNWQKVGSVKTKSPDKEIGIIKSPETRNRMV